jgi:ATP-binding cassette subfamily B protein
MRGSIEFRQVSFRYHDQHDLVLKDLSLTLPAGSFTAIVGPSGAGKTTMCALIPRFYEVSAGSILIDGHDIRDIQRAALRRNIGVVQQDVYLFTGTVAENIRYAQPDASDEAVIAAAKQANAHEFILALPQGYNTDIGQRGVKLSGGQKQRLSIARVFLKNPPIIIFDEATSALDSESEQAVQTALERLAYQRTTLVIAHRLSTIRHAERIVVLTNQGIAEQGSHRELMRQQGVYARLYTTAADRFEDVGVV